MTEIELPVVHVEGGPVPNRPGAEGYGEYVTYNQHDFHAPVGQHIAKHRAVSLRWEGNWSSRVRGDREYIIVAWNGSGFSVLEEPLPGDVRTALAKYRGMTPEQAIAAARECVAAERRRREEERASLPKCRKCGKPFLILFDEESETGICSTCLKEAEGTDHAENA